MPAATQAALRLAARPMAVADRSMATIRPPASRWQMWATATPGPQPISRRWSSGPGAMVRTAHLIRSGTCLPVILRPLGSRFLPGGSTVVSGIAAGNAGGRDGDRPDDARRLHRRGPHWTDQPLHRPAGPAGAAEGPRRPALRDRLRPGRGGVPRPGLRDGVRHRRQPSLQRLAGDRLPAVQCPAGRGRGAGAALGAALPAAVRHPRGRPRPGRGSAALPAGRAPPGPDRDRAGRGQAVRARRAPVLAARPARRRASSTGPSCSPTSWSPTPSCTPGPRCGCGWSCAATSCTSACTTPARGCCAWSPATPRARPAAACGWSSSSPPPGG